MDKFTGVKNVIFDLDDTLFKHSDNQVNEMFKMLDLEHNIEFENQIEYFWNNLESGLEKGQKVTLDEVYRIAEEMIPFLSEIGLSSKKWLETILKADTITLIDGADDILDYLKSKEYNIYACTNWFSLEQMEILKNFGILSSFKEVYGWDIIGSKPYCNELGNLINEKNKSEFVIIGDSPNTDIKFAHNVGTSSIWYNERCREIDDNLKPTVEIKSLLEIKNYL